MLNRKNWILMMLLIALVAFTGCSDDDDPVTPPPPGDNFDAVAGAVTAVMNDNAVTPGIISAADLYADVTSKAPTLTVVDVRRDTDYANGHIQGAIHSTLGTLIADIGSGKIPTDKTIVVVCYTGQSAGHAKMALELLGYDAKSLAWGMSSWSPDVTGNKWSEAEKCKDLLTAPETTGNNGDLVEHDYPSLDDDLEARVAAMLTGGFKGLGYTSDLDNNSDYFLLNYWGESDYLGTNPGSGTTGHIPGAFQFTPYTSLTMDGMLKNLPTDKTIVVYCWTGQHSSQVTAALNVMGYDAVSLTYGANSLMWSSLKAGKWSDANTKDYPLVQ